MIGDALIKMYSALKRKKYSFDKRTDRGGEDECNPFSYFTTIAYNAFVNRIKKEKRHHEAEKNYRERVYAEIMSDPKTCNSFVYVSPTKSDDDDYYNED
jgi:DNA-directed RNA polymerase specialized sigma24 family protein